MKNNWIVYFLLLPLLFGCVHTKIVDEQDLVSIAGIDYLDDKMQIIAVYNNYKLDKSMEDKLLEINIDKDEDILDHLDRQASKPILLGGTEVLIIGKTAAAEGVFPIIDTLQRGADTGSRIFLVLTENPIKELLTNQLDSKGNAHYISNMIDQNIKNHDIPKTNMHLFSADFFQKGKGAYLPILKKIDENRLQIVGLGIFDKKKLVHKIPADKLFYFKLLVDEHNKSTFSVNVDKNSAGITNIKSKLTFAADYDNLTVHIDYKIKGVVKKYTGKKVDKKTLIKIEENTEKKIDNGILQLLEEFQALNIDPIGIERKFRQQNRNFDSKKWKDQYKNVQFKFHSKVIIIESGTVE